MAAMPVSSTAGTCPEICRTSRRTTDARRRPYAPFWGGGGLPIVLGGDHGISIPVLRALGARGPATLVHVDAHIDWREAVDGFRKGYSSPIRRASELGHIDRIFQIGMRGQGSAHAEEVRAALKPRCDDILSAFEGVGVAVESVIKGIRRFGLLCKKHRHMGGSVKSACTNLKETL